MREFESYHKLFHESTLRLYYISTEGKVGFIWRKDLKANNNRIDERLINWVEPHLLKQSTKPFLSVTITSQKFALKKLVAKYFMPNYKASLHLVEHKDNDFTNCSLNNLYLIDKHKRLARLARDRITQVIAVKPKGSGQWTHYGSVTKAAEALYVSPKTMFAYFRRKIHYSILNDYDFKINGETFIPRKRTGANYKVKLREGGKPLKEGR